MPKQDKGGQRELTPKERKVIAALLTGGNVARAAQIAKVSERTIRRMMTRAEFRAALDEQTEKAIEAAARMLADASGAAVLTLREISTSRSATDGARVRASDSILSHMLRVRELHEIERRLSELEARTK